MNKKVLSHVQYRGWLYVVVLLVAIFLWTTVFDALAQPDANEKVAITFFTDDVDFDGMATCLNDQKQTLTTQPLKIITTESVPTNDVMMGSLLATRKITSDLLVIKDSLLQVDTEDIAKVNPKIFVPFNVEKLQNAVGNMVTDLQFYYVEEYAVGIYLNAQGGASSNNFGSYYTGKDRCVLFFNNESPNLASLYNFGNANDSAGLDVLCWLLSPEQ